MLESLSSLEKKDLKINVHNSGTFAWCHILNDSKEEIASFRIDTYYSEEESLFKINIFIVNQHKKIKEEINHLLSHIKRKVEITLGKHIRIIQHRSSPAKETWSYPTYLDDLRFPILFVNIVLYFILMRFVPYGDFISLSLLFLSIPIGWCLSFGHHWGAGAPYAGFEKMIQHMKYKYMVFNFSLALLPYIICYFYVS